MVGGPGHALLQKRRSGCRTERHEVIGVDTRWLDAHGRGSGPVCRSRLIERARHVQARCAIARVISVNAGCEPITMVQ